MPCRYFSIQLQINFLNLLSSIMSYEEVERGLPPVNEVNLISSWRRPRPITTSTGTKLHPPFALTNIQPNGTESKSRNPKLSRNNSNASTVTLNHENRESPFQGEYDNSQNTTKRYVIKEDDDEMRVFKVIGFNPENEESLSETGPNKKVINCSSHYEKYTWLKCRNIWNLILLLLPVTCFIIVLQFVTQLLAKNFMPSVPVIGVFICQPIFWAGLLLAIIQKFRGRVNLFGDAFGKRNVCFYLLQIISLGFLSTIGLLFQLVSLIHLDMIISVGMLFCPLIIASFINHINRTRKLAIELLVTSSVMYTGIVLITIPVLLTGSEKRQEQLIIGIGSSVASMMILIPCCLILQNLRRLKVDDSMEIISFGFFGTINSILFGLFLYLGFHNLPLLAVNEMNGLGIAMVITFTFLGTLSMYLESKFYRINDNNPIEQERNPSCWLKIARARFFTFIILIFVELVKLAFDFRVDYFTSPFSFFGILAIIMGYLLTVGFEYWYNTVGTHNNNQAQESLKPNNSGSRVGKLSNWTPFEFLPWIIGIRPF